MLHVRYLAGFWICFDFKIKQSCEYTRDLNMSGLHTRFWIKYFIIDVWQYYGYALDSKMFDSIMDMPWILNMPGL